MSVDDSVQGVVKFARKTGFPMERSAEIVAEYNAACSTYRTVHRPPFNMGGTNRNYGRELVEYNSRTWSYAANKAREFIRETIRERGD